MNTLEQQLHYPLGDTLPEIGTALEVAPGVKWIRMALPFALDHINLWLLRDNFNGREGWTIVDCCIDSKTSREQWERIFETALEGLPVVRVLVTHMHPDHLGLSNWLCERWNAPLWISATDYYTARALLNGEGNHGPAGALFYTSHGLEDKDTLDKITQRTNYFPTLVPALPSCFHRLLEGKNIQIGDNSWQCIAGYGHAPEHIALYNATLNVLISGDMVLPRISTNVSVFNAEPTANPLALFLESLDKYRALPIDTFVLPSHGKPFEGLHTRIDQLQSHHRDRLAEVVEACAERACCSADIVPIMFKRPLDAHQITFALGEAAAHLHLLWFAGKLKRECDGQGVYRFAPA